MDFLTILLVAIVFFLIGAAIVGFIWYLVGISRRMRKGKNPVVSSNPDLDEIARLMRHTQTQELVVSMDSKFYNSAQELSTAQKHRLAFTSNVLAKWLAEPASQPPPINEPDISATQPPPITEPDIPAPQPILSTFEPVSSPPPELPPQEAVLDFTPPFMGEPVETVKPISTELPDMMQGILKPSASPAPAFKSIAEQIDEVLQAHLAGTPLESRGITVREAPDRGITVTLDGKQYASVMDVPDEEVRNVIRDAVVEWDTKK